MKGLAGLEMFRGFMLRGLRVFARLGLECFEIKGGGGGLRS